MFADRLSGAERYTDLSKGCWLDMMKACSLKDEAGHPGLQMASSQLVRTILDSAEGVKGKSRAEQQQYEAVVLEAQQVKPSFAAKLGCQQ